MSDQPLQALISSPLDLLDKLPKVSWLTAGNIVTWILYTVFAFWAIYTIVAIYHWLKYSHASWIAFPAIFLHFAVSLALMSYALTGNAFFLTAYLP